MAFKSNNIRNIINTKEELVKLLKSYEDILSIQMVDYLKSLIDLEFSVVRDNISDKDRVVLSELQIYRRVAMYNIYNRALYLFNKSNIDLVTDDDLALTIYTSIKEKNIKLFDFDYNLYANNFDLIINLPGDYKCLSIGNISLFQTFDNDEQRNLELKNVMSILENLYNRKNPYSSSSDYDKYNYLRQNSEHYKKIHEYEEKYRQLDCKKELTDEEKREVEITKYFNDLLLEDYGLTRNSFIEEKNGINFDSYKVSELKKTLVKKMPNLTITNHIKYL